MSVHEVSLMIYHTDIFCQRDPVTVEWKSEACRWRCMISANSSPQSLHSIRLLDTIFLRCLTRIYFVTSPCEANFCVRLGTSRFGCPRQIKQNKGRWSFIADRIADSRGHSCWSIVSGVSFFSWEFSLESFGRFSRGRRQVSPSWN